MKLRVEAVAAIADLAESSELLVTRERRAFQFEWEAYCRGFEADDCEYRPFGRQPGRLFGWPTDGYGWPEDEGPLRLVGAYLKQCERDLRKQEGKRRKAQR